MYYFDSRRHLQEVLHRYLLHTVYTLHVPTAEQEMKYRWFTNPPSYTLCTYWNAWCYYWTFVLHKESICRSYMELLWNTVNDAKILLSFSNSKLSLLVGISLELFRSRNSSCALHWISTFYFDLWHKKVTL